MTITHGHAWLTEETKENVKRNLTAGHAPASTLSSQIKGCHPVAFNPHLSQGKLPKIRNDESIQVAIGWSTWLPNRKVLRGASQPKLCIPGFCIVISSRWKIVRFCCFSEKEHNGIKSEKRMKPLFLATQPLAAGVKKALDPHLRIVCHRTGHKARNRCCRRTLRFFGSKKIFRRVSLLKAAASKELWSL